MSSYIVRGFQCVFFEIVTIGMLLIGSVWLLQSGYLLKDPVKFALGCDTPCIIVHSLGGNVGLFESAGNAVKDGSHAWTIIDGRCSSACTIFADLGRPN